MTLMDEVRSVWAHLPTYICCKHGKHITDTKNNECLKRKSCKFNVIENSKPTKTLFELN